MKFQNKLLAIIYPSILLPVVFIITVNFIITDKKVTDLQFELLNSTVNFALSQSDANFKTMDALGMAKVEFFEEVTKKQVFLAIKKNQRPNTSLVIIDAKSQKIVFSTGDDALGLLLNTDQINTMLSQRKGHGEYALVTQTGEKIKAMVAFADYPNWNWLIVKSVNKNQLYRYVIEAMALTLVATSVFLVLVFFLVYRLSHAASGALNALEKGANRLAKNNFNIPIEFKANDEFSSLANSFNGMAAAIKKTQNSLEATLDAIPDLLFEVDANGRIFGYHTRRDDLLAAPPEFFIGKCFGDVLPPLATQECMKALHQASIDGWSQGAMYSLPLSQGETWFELSVASMPESNSLERRFVVLARDITERMRAQQDLKMSLREKTALLMEVHHRVKNNLQVITSLLRLEAGRSANTDTKGVLGSMGGRIYAMSQLHESLYRSGTFASVDLGAYLGKLAAQAFKAQVIHLGLVELKLNMGSVLVGMDQATAAGLVLNELISNCLKHGFPEGRSGEVSVELQPVHDTDQPEGNKWCLRVSDTGVGLPSDIEEKRTNSLGLQLVSDLSEQLGGTLEIASLSTQGAQFSVLFVALAPAALVMPV